jgi:hypothetical protein
MIMNCGSLDIFTHALAHTHTQIHTHTHTHMSAHHTLQEKSQEGHKNKDSGRSGKQARKRDDRAGGSQPLAKRSRTQSTIIMSSEDEDDDDAPLLRSWTKSKSIIMSSEDNDGPQGASSFSPSLSSSRKSSLALSSSGRPRTSAARAPVVYTEDPESCQEDEEDDSGLPEEQAIEETKEDTVDCEEDEDDEEEEEDEDDEDEEEADLSASHVLREYWFPPSRNYPQRLFQVQLSDGTLAIIVAEDRDHPSRRTAETNTFYQSVIHQWRADDHLEPERPAQRKSGRK